METCQEFLSCPSTPIQRERDEETPSNPTFLGFYIPTEFLPFHYPGPQPPLSQEFFAILWNSGKESNIPMDTALVEFPLSHLDHSQSFILLHLPLRRFQRGSGRWWNFIHKILIFQLSGQPDLARESLWNVGSVEFIKDICPGRIRDVSI